MSEDQKDRNAAPATGDANAQNSGQSSDAATSKKDTVAYETYSKVLSRLKKMESQFDEVRDKSTRLEAEKLEVEGKKDEALDHYKKEIDALKIKLRDNVSNFAFKSVKSQIEAEASKMGCVDSEALVKLLDLKAVEVDHETFNADNGTVKSLLDAAKTERPWLFDRQGPKIESHIPKSGQIKNENPAIKDMKKDDLVAAIKS